MGARDDVANLRDLAHEVAHEVGEYIVRERPRRLAYSAKRSPVDIVTEMDQAAQDRIIAAIAAARPDDANLGEEEGGRAGTSGRTWVIDPIDGTTNYLYELPAYAVSIACVTGDPQVWGAWQPIAGAVAAPALGAVYSAARGRGAQVHRGGAAVPLSASVCAHLPTSLVATGFSHLADRRRQQAAVLGHVVGEVRDIRRFGSAAVDLCLLAEGRVDGYFETGLNPWDIAAGWLVATEAGAVVGGSEGDLPDARLVWGSAPGLVPVLPDLVLSAHRRVGIF